jgi:hypothetical protein
MTLRRKLIVLLAASACAYVFITPTAAPDLGSIESAAPQYFDTTAMAPPGLDNEAGMTALREQAGLALAQLQTKTALMAGR